MIQVSGTTYRIRSEYDRHQVYCVNDDRRVGMFEHRPSLRILESDIAAERLLDIARAALRSGRLPWGTTARAVHAKASRSNVRALASLLVVLWPSR